MYAYIVAGMVFSHEQHPTADIFVNQHAGSVGIDFGSLTKTADKHFAINTISPLLSSVA